MSACDLLRITGDRLTWPGVTINYLIKKSNQAKVQENKRSQQYSASQVYRNRMNLERLNYYIIWYVKTVLNRPFWQFWQITNRRIRNRTVDRRTFVPASIELMFCSNSPIVKQMWASAIVFLCIFDSTHCCCTYCTCTTYYKRKTKL